MVEGEKLNNCSGEEALEVWLTESSLWVKDCRVGLGCCPLPSSGTFLPKPELRLRSWNSWHGTFLPRSPSLDKVAMCPQTQSNNERFPDSLEIMESQNQQRFLGCISKGMCSDLRRWLSCCSLCWSRHIRKAVLSSGCHRYSMHCPNWMYRRVNEIKRMHIGTQFSRGFLCFCSSSEQETLTALSWTIFSRVFTAAASSLEDRNMTSLWGIGQTCFLARTIRILKIIKCPLQSKHWASFPAGSL